MTHKRIIVFSLFLIINSCDFIAFASDIIPKPNSQIITSGEFILSNNTKINYSDDFKISGDFLMDYIISEEHVEEYVNKINFIKKNIKNDEGYEIEILTNEINIYSKSNKGAFYAVQTLRQLLPVEFENNKTKLFKVNIPCQVIKDSPKFKYRGMHLDVSRHMFSVEFIKKYIDALAMLKFNTFHWHLTEDQGWRIEIKKYPKLNSIGSYRDSTLIGHYTDKPIKYDKTRYGGYYTQKEIKEIVEFANSREVLIIPEIEMPGHAQAAIASYPYLSCRQEKIGVATTWGVFEDIYCTRESTFSFLEDVIDEVIELFPGKYIHIGGDEAPKKRWEECSHCQNLIKKEGLKDEHELQSYFITRMEKYINSKGKKIIGWDEILDGGLAPNATVMSWRGESGGIKAAQMGHEVIMSPNANLYFDHYQTKKEGEPVAIGGFTPIEEVYNYNPIPKELHENEKKYIIGAQANVWTEYMKTSEHVEYMVFPRILALSEVLWSSNSTNFTEFKLRAENYFERLEKLDINYSKHLEKEEIK
jgi:hexosaminidase